MVPESDLISLEKGDILCAQGAEPDYVMYVLRGEIALQHSPGLFIERDGHIVTFKSGTLIGEGSAILERPYMVTCVGYTSGLYARVTAERVRDEISSCPKLSQMIIKAQATKLELAFDYIMKNYKKVRQGELDDIFKPDHGVREYFE